ncbi:hypothetical protein OsJ_20639 [Oryza sativa Japonica Group]|uniref:Inositol polyphosphate-related phosphatase domain-containing protein n=1 Tax=Oryza sativa subsp. japonica TaxID=39947 RepID=B9FS95_ORYSJ|nr:hypothetical protein OsJ_20639 [Oryza sativa Japonica Group]
MSSNMFGKKGWDSNGMDTSGSVCRSSSDIPINIIQRARLKSASLNCVGSPPRKNNNATQYRMFVATWNVGGRTPNKRLNLQDFLQVEESPDIYVLGFQEIVPLTAGNVLVLEDNEPAARWLALIHQALNMPQEPADGDEPSPLTPPPSSSTTTSESSNGARTRRRDAVSRSASGNLFFHTPSLKMLSNSYRVDSALVKTCNCSPEHSSVRRRAAEVRDHLASGEKEGDELRRNADVAEILKSAHFPGACRPAPAAARRVPERILDHDRMIWLGDLNYRMSLSYDETRTLLEDNDWDALLEKDQLLIEREAGRVFRGWNEGKICFAPTYKYTHNSDAYAGETAKSKKKRRRPHGDGIEQLQYLRGESRFSDHRPVCGVFAVEWTAAIATAAAPPARS